MARIERQVERVERKVAGLHVQMAEQASDHLAVAALDEQLRALLAEREELEGLWMAAAEVAG
jgi:hypothetical protein